MSESLLSFSEVLLYGREVKDLQIKQIKVRLADEIGEADSLPSGITRIDGVKLRDGDRVLIQKGDTDNIVSGIYKAEKQADDTFNLVDRKTVDYEASVYVKRGREFKRTFWVQKQDSTTNQLFVEKRQRGKGANNFIGDQFGGDARLARIYGFAYEGTYYELPEPTVFLVHGEGEKAAAPSGNGGADARSPLDPSVSGVAAADYQVSADVMVWNYDKADFTIRMDVMTGQFEQVLLDIYFGYDSPAISGARVSGARVSGARVSGARVSGARVSGARVSGARARGSED
ncbi:hypothetical protein [Ruegeria atlantica]|uniref:hypothetical protein n=1 Tax=Ruegeria atlantica TaxID=81569 RepID=UPI00147C5F97|nr:hypothetical protein [Ruegeria atlantica]